MNDQAKIYPEHQKLLQNKEQSQALGDFLEWLQGKYTIGTYLPVIYRSSGESYEIFEERTAQNPLHAPVSINVTDLLAEYFEIDLSKIEDEKRQMLDAMRGGKP